MNQKLKSPIFFAIFRQSIIVSFCVALVIMIVGAYLAASEKHRYTHSH